MTIGFDKRQLRGITNVCSANLWLMASRMNSIFMKRTGWTEQLSYFYKSRSQGGAVYRETSAFKTTRKTGQSLCLGTRI